MTVWLGVLLALLTSVSWSFANVFIQKSGRALGAARAMLWALLLGALMCGAASMLLDTRSEPITSAVVGWAIAAGLAAVLAYVCLFASFARARLGIAVPLVSSWAVVSAGLSLAVFGEKLGLSQAAGAACVLCGVILVSIGASREEVGGAQIGVPTVRGSVGACLAAALGAGVGFGVMVPAMGRIAPATGEFAACAVVYAVAIAIGAPLALALRQDISKPPRLFWPLILATAFTETAGFVAVTLARRYAPAAVTSPVASLAATLTVLYGWFVLKERPGKLVRVGAVLASVGVVVLSL